MAVRKIEVQVLGDADSLKRALRGSRTEASKWAKDVDGASRRGRTFGGGLVALSKGAGIAGAALGGGLAVGLKKSVDAFQEAERVGAQTEAVIKSTGGAANVTAKHIASLATAISRKSGIDDEAIQKGENLLLTFTKIRNEAGKGNKVFDQATRVVTDMSVALDQDMKASAIQVGKALNDPVKGLTALQRVGVAFTDQQRQQITTLVESGRRMQAQKLILKELNTEFGGSAAAAGKTFEGSINRAKVAVGNLGEAIGGRVAPLIAKVATALTGFVNQIVDGRGRPAEFAKAVVSAFSTVKGIVGSVIGAVRGWFNRNKADIQQAARAVQNLGKAWLAVFQNVILPVVRRVIPGVRQMVQGGLRAIGGIVKVFTGVLTGDWRKAWNGVKQIVSGALKAIGGLIRAATAPHRAAAAAIGNAIKGVIGGAFEALRRIVRTVVRFVLGLLDKVLGGMSSIIRVASKLPIVGDKFDGVADAIDRAREKVRNLRDGINQVPRKLKVGVQISAAFSDDFGSGSANGLFGQGSGRKITDRVRKASTRRATQHLRRIGPLPFLGGLGSKHTGKGDVDQFNDDAARFGLQITSGYRPGDDGWHGVDRARDYSNSTGPTPQMMAFAQHMARNFGSRLLELIYTPLGFSIDNGQRTAPFAQEDHYDHVHVALRRGGEVPGFGFGDKIHALLEPGEFVIKSAVAKKLGPLLEALNAQRFKRGGLASLNRVFPEHGLGEPGKFMSFDAIRRVFEASGADPRTAYIFATIARGESGGGRMGGMPGIRGDDPGGTKGWGLVQNTPGVWSKNSKTYKLMQKLGGEAALRNPFVNAKVALSLLSESGWGAWKGTKFMHDPGAGVESALTKGDRRFMASGMKGSGKPEEQPSKGRWWNQIDEILELDRLAVTRAEGTRKSADDLKAIKKLRHDLALKMKKLRERLAEVNKALKGKLKKDTRGRLLEERKGIFGELGSVLGERNSLADQIRTIRGDAKDTKADRANRATEALAGIKGQLGDLAAQAAASFRAGLEQAIDSNLKARLATIAGGADSTALRAITGRQSAREDAQNQRDLLKAQQRLERARLAGASPRRIEQLEAAVDEIQGRILEKRITAQEDAANAEAEAARAGLDQQEADLAASLANQLGALFSNLEQRKIAYSSFVDQVRAILGPFGVGFANSASDAAAIPGVSTGGGLAAQVQSSWNTAQGKRLAKSLWAEDKKTGPIWADVIKLLGFDPRDGKKLNFRGLARGGFAPGGPVWVGEEGPELALLPKGTRVHSAQQSRQMVQQGRMVNVEHLEIHSTGRVDHERLVNRIAFKVLTAS